MCGICGFVSSNDISEYQLKIMNDKMINRGPDDSGEIILPFDSDTRIGLAHRRLSIQDLSTNGHQPLFSNDNEIVIVFNGEIYNFLDLRNELKESYKFKSRCDTEVIVAAYKKWGEEFLDKIDGMFGIALYDIKSGKLILARDRIGKKPLYYYYKNNELVFASTLKAIMSYPSFERKIDKSVLPRYLFNQYIGGDDCIFEDTFKVKPGERIVFDGKQLTKSLFWSLLDVYNYSKQNLIKDYPEAKQELKTNLIESTKRRLIADVPVGTFLSGGIDSSLVTAVAQSLSKEPIRTFSIGFEEKEYDEAPFAKDISEHLGTKHENHYVTESEMLELVSSIPEFYDEPFADSSQIPSMLVAKQAKEKVSVVLTGDGGDEFFCGYRMYEKLKQAQKIDGLANIARLIIKENSSIYNKMTFSVKAIISNKDKSHKTQFGRMYYINSIRKILNMPGAVLEYDESIINETNWQKRRMLLDSITYLPDNNLCKVDRATMRYSLEARNPLLDTAFVETSFRIPHKFKYFNGDKKHILKDLAYDYIPKELLDRPKKGFSVPIDKWLRGVLKEELLELTSEEYLEKQGIFNSCFTCEFVREYVKNGDKGSFTGENASHIVWPLYMFQKWYEYYMK